jgi:hypothetical protein
LGRFPPTQKVEEAFECAHCVRAMLPTLIWNRSIRQIVKPCFTLFN